MIQEPQEPEIIEIPIVNSMNTIETNSLKNITGNKNQSIQNNKNRTTLIQIPKQSSKPRIFLLTRPLKPQTVRIATQSVQRPQENHPQKTASNIANLTQSKIIRIPFLPRSQVQTFSVKSNQANQVRKKDTIGVPIEVNLYQNQNHNTVQASQLENHKQNSILAQPEAVQYVIAQAQVNTNQLTPVSTEISNQLQTQQSVKSAIPQRTVLNNHLNLSENKTIKTPLTLTSMAGIELTGADMSLSQADMSGAMPPTATVEEINVPVFIDEYLQQAAISTTSVSTTNNNIHYISNNNNHNNNQSNGKGNEVNNCLDTFENFEFDIDLLTEDNYKEDDKDKEFQMLEQQQEYLQHSQQTQLTEVDGDTNLIFNTTTTTTTTNSINIEDLKKQQLQKQQQQLQLQLMLEDLLFNNNNNTNNIDNNNSCKSNNNNNNNNIIINTTSNDDNNNNNNNNTNNMAIFFNDLDDDVVYSEEYLFKVADFSQTSDFMDLDSLNLSDNINIEEAVDFNNSHNDFNLKDCFITPQSKECMLTGKIGISHEISKAEPTISEAESTNEPTMAPVMMHYDYDTYSSTIDATASVSAQPSSCSSNSLKRNASHASSNMEKKRKKLTLDTNSCTNMDFQLKSDISTPNIIKTILQNDKSLDMGISDNSINSIFNDLISTSPQDASVKYEIFADDVTNDFSPPNTPCSVNSVSNQTNFTGFMNTAPNSPASSIATTTNTSVTNKRGRGRPAKLHSDMPDISQLQHLSETDQKKILERIKNNEASRKSRLKHKEREIDLEKEENSLSLKKAQLEDELRLQKIIEKKLQNALKAQHFQ